MTETLASRNSKNTLVVPLLSLVIGILIGWLVLPVRSTRALVPQVMHGRVATVDSTGSAIAFDPKGIGKGGKIYSIRGAWFWKDDSWSDTTSCLPPLTKGQEIEMAVVHPKDSPQADHVLWVKCLSDGEPL